MIKNCLILLSFVFLFSCDNKKVETPSENKKEEIWNYAQIGIIHNDAMDFFYSNLKNESSNLKSSGALITQIVKLTTSYFKEKFNYEYEKIDDIKENSYKHMEIIEKSRNFKSAIIYEGLSDFGNEILDNARIICLNYGIQGYDEAIVEFDNLIKKVEQDAKQEEKNILLSSLYIGKASCTYWTENFDKWLQLFRNEDGNEGHLKGYREFMGQVMNDDISGFAQGAIGGAIVGALAGTPACPGIGTAAGAVSGALTGGMWSAVVSSGWSAAFCASSIQPSLELDYGLDEI